MASSHDAHDAHDSTGPVGEHPGVPVVTDEAADSPSWLPMVGLGLLVLALVFGLYRRNQAHEVEVGADGVAVEQVAQ